MAVDNAARGLALRALAGTGITAGSLTYAKLQNETASTLLGNPTGSPAAPSEITIGGGLYLSGTVIYGAVDHPGYVAGNWYATIPFVAAAVGAAIPVNSIRLMPFTISKPITVSALGARITTLSASGNFQLAIYANNAATGRPTGSALCSTGSITTGSTGAVSAVVSANTLLVPGTYWMAINQDNAVAVYTSLATTGSTAGYLVGSTTLATVTVSSTAQFFILSTPQTFGTWPDITSATFTEVATATNALVFMKAA